MFQSLIASFNAWLRRETRVTPRGVRGRIYARTGETGPISARATFKPTITPSRVYRAAEDAWYQCDPVTGTLTKE